MKSEKTKACEIPYSVKEKVYERDNHCCLWCERYVDVSNACCHYIARSQGGLGIEENILTLCADCHRLYDGRGRNEMKPVFSKYLKSKYKNWDEKKLIYRKWGMYDS